MRRLFADTFYWVALANARDSAHHQVLAFISGLRSAEVITTDEILTEFLTMFASNLQMRTKAAAVVDGLIWSATTLVIPQTRESFLAGLELYRARPDKRYSLTDCISMQTMRRQGISEVLTNDHHFQQEGFRAIFRDL